MLNSWKFLGSREKCLHIKTSLKLDQSFNLIHNRGQIKDISGEYNHTHNTCKLHCLECLGNIPVFFKGIKERNIKG